MAAREACIRACLAGVLPVRWQPVLASQQLRRKLTPLLLTHAHPPSPPLRQREIDGIFRRMLVEGASAKQQAAPLTAAALVRLPRWKKAEPLVKSYLGNTLHLLGEAELGGAGYCLGAAPCSRLWWG